VIIKSDGEIELIRHAGHINALIMNEVVSEVKPGVKTKLLDKQVSLLCKKHKVTPAFKGYNDYKHSLCVSLNEDAVHAPPSDRKILPGDVVSLDFRVKYKGYCSDLAVTVGVPPVSDRIAYLISTCRECLYDGISSFKIGNRLGSISHSIHKKAVVNGFNVIVEVGGHGIGREVHEPPFIPNYGFVDEGILLWPGMVFALEPIVSVSKTCVVLLKDGWTLRSKPPTIVAHFEHTVVLTEHGAEILTI